MKVQNLKDFHIKTLKGDYYSACLNSIYLIPSIQSLEKIYLFMRSKKA